jgi:TonB family protein
MKLLFAALVATAALPCALAQAGAVPGAHMMVGDTLVYPGNPAYPPALAARGVQGRVVVRVSAGAKGAAPSVTVRDSSRSRELDAAALALVRTQGHVPAGPGMGQGELLVPIRFRKDSPSSLRTKTCADLNVDKAYFTATFPDKKLFELDAVSMAMDTVIFTLPGPLQMAYASNSEAVAAAAIAECATRPAETFFTVMQQQASKLSRK